MAVVAPQRRSTNPVAGASSAAPSEGRTAAASAAALAVSPVPSAGGSPTQLCHRANHPQFFSLQTFGDVPSIRINYPGLRFEDEDRSGNRSKNASSLAASNNNHTEKSDEVVPRRSSSSSSSGDSVFVGSSLPCPLSSSQSPGAWRLGDRGGRDDDAAAAAVASCNFYYGALTNADAKSRLHRAPVGTFLLRDSSDRRFAYSLSVKTSRGTTSIRISSSSGGDDPPSSAPGRCFRLDSDPNQKSQMPSFGSVLELVEHYHLSALGSASSSSSSSRDGTKRERRSHCVLLESSGRSDTPMVLRRPLELSPAPLGHLCRRLVNNLVAGETKRIALVERMAHVKDDTKHQLKQYLLRYPYRV